MLKSFIVFSRYFLFWMLFFFLDRLLFLSYFFDRISKMSLSEIVSTFWYALRLDTSMAAYISAIPLITYVILLHFKSFNFPKLLAKGYVVFFILIFSIISVANLNLYREWGSKINFRALDLAFNSPKEAITSISSSPIVLSLFVILVMTLGLTFLSSKIISYKITDRTKPLWP